MNQETLAAELVNLAKSIVAADRSSKLTLSINGDNDAFFKNPDGEYARLLEQAAKMVRQGKTNGRLVDSNGNVVGKYEVK